MLSLLVVEQKRGGGIKRGETEGERGQEGGREREKRRKEKKEEGREEEGKGKEGKGGREGRGRESQILSYALGNSATKSLFLIHNCRLLFVFSLSSPGVRARTLESNVTV